MSGKKEFIPNKLPVKINMSDNLYKALNTASRSLGELNGFIKTIPNQNILINSLVLQEAKDSSEIENIITTHDDIFIAQINDDKIAKNTKEVINYEKALKLGFELIQKDKLLLNRHILSIQKILQSNNAGFRTQSGTTLKNPTTGEIKHIPPQHIDNINELMDNLQNYINNELDDLDPLIRIAIIHYQFETIHPFYDGNGRTGRIINVLYLTKMGLLDLPILYLSAYIIQNKTKYYELLENVSKDNNWEDWILYILVGINKTSIATIKLIKDIESSIKNFTSILKEEAPKIYSKDFVELLFSFAYTKIQSVEEKLNISRQTASKYLKTCEELGLLRCIKLNNMSYYVNLSLFEILKKGIVC
ncbi:Fic family protein [Campylobacter pinnipediorum]|uniref:Fic family protein n=1 Tax=Campylobacter pinnipediorum TaxID=1965231 RepID=UPI00084DE0A1|nr:Fic family protein [Campylobacter pinnipediorum]